MAQEHNNHFYDEVCLVKGAARASPREVALRPAERFQRSCVCHGQLLEMHSSYGWIQPLQNIEHDDAHLHGGKVYLSSEDMRPGVALRPKDLVVFYLYVDSDGLGAEDCFPMRGTGKARRSHRNPVSAALPSVLAATPTPNASPASRADCVPQFDINDDTLFDEEASQVACSAASSSASTVAILHPASTKNEHKWCVKEA